jgi:hypothetical protein
MPPIGFVVRIGGAVPGATLDDAALKGILKEAWFDPGKQWHQELRPKHFTKQGGGEYAYAPRAGEPGNERKNFWTSYTGRKQKRFGHTLPLVYSGDSSGDSLLVRSRVARIENSPNGVKVILSGANKANWHNPKSNIDMRAELTRISDLEVAELTNVLEDSLIAKLHRFDVTVTTAGERPRFTSVTAFFHGD